MKKRIIYATLVFCLLASIMATNVASADRYAPRIAISNAPVFEVYHEGSASDSIYYGAKFEPRAGIYAGTPADKRIAGLTNVLSARYVDFNNREEFDAYWWEGIGRSNFSEGGTEKLHVVNWNYHDRNNSINPSDYDDYIRRNINKMGDSGWDILLVFGKEMDIDDNFRDPGRYVEMYRHVARYAREKSNIAMVWSPNALSDLNVTWDSFWPGSEYVDWIGTSLYIDPHFLGDPAQDRINNADRIFFTGAYAHTITRMRPIAEYAQRQSKPIIITEGGIAHRSTVTNTQYHEWAQNQIHIMYATIPRYFPSVKIAINFNNYSPHDRYWYNIGDIPLLRTALIEALRDPAYLSHYGAQASFSYQTFQGGTLSRDVRLSAVSYQPGDQHTSVRYIVDGNLEHEATLPPYNFTLRQNARTLTVQKVSHGNVISHKDYTFSAQDTPSPTPGPQPPAGPSGNITVNPTSSTVYVNGRAVAFEAYLIDDFNFFKLRDMAMAVNGTEKQFAVGWDGAANSITLTSGQPYAPVGGELAPGDGTPKTAQPTASNIFVNGERIELIAYNIEGNNFFRLRDVMRLFNINVDYDGNVLINTSRPYVD